MHMSKGSKACKHGCSQHEKLINGRVEPPWTMQIRKDTDLSLVPISSKIWVMQDSRHASLSILPTINTATEQRHDRDIHGGRVIVQQDVQSWATGSSRSMHETTLMGQRVPNGQRVVLKGRERKVHHLRRTMPRFFRTSASDCRTLPEELLAACEDEALSPGRCTT